MVRALLAGTKTQTRRIVKPQPTDAIWQSAGLQLGADVVGSVPAVHPTFGLGLMAVKSNHKEIGFPQPNIPCPYGRLWDRLWVRESIQLVERYTIPGDRFDDPPEERATSKYMADGTATVADAWPWKAKALPSIHCPRGLSRITLEITEVRVQRLQEISPDDAAAEGVDAGQCGGCSGRGECLHPGGVRGRCEVFMEGYRSAYSRLWDEIHGAGSWAANPWVWCVGFRRVTP